MSSSSPCPAQTRSPGNSPSGSPSDSRHREHPWVRARPSLTDHTLSFRCCGQGVLSYCLASPSCGCKHTNTHGAGVAPCVAGWAPPASRDEEEADCAIYSAHLCSAPPRATCAQAPSHSLPHTHIALREHPVPYSVENALSGSELP